MKTSEFIKVAVGPALRSLGRAQTAARAIAPSSATGGYRGSQRLNHAHSNAKGAVKGTADGAVDRTAYANQLRNYRNQSRNFRDSPDGAAWRQQQAATPASVAHKQPNANIVSRPTPQATTTQQATTPQAQRAYRQPGPDDGRLIRRGTPSPSPVKTVPGVAGAAPGAGPYDARLIQRPVGTSAAPAQNTRAALATNGQRGAGIKYDTPKVSPQAAAPVNTAATPAATTGNVATPGAPVSTAPGTTPPQGGWLDYVNNHKLQFAGAALGGNVMYNMGKNKGQSNAQEQYNQMAGPHGYYR